MELESFHKQARGKTYLLSGATSGIGYHIAKTLVASGTNVIGIGRSSKRCETVREEIAGTGVGNVSILHADLSSTRVARCVADQSDQLAKSFGSNHIDGIINNAATIPFWQTLTAEGFDLQWAVNYLAGFTIVNTLLSARCRTQEAFRIINVASGSHYGARLDWDDIQTFRRYRPFKAYRRTKTAQVLFTAELNRRYGSEGVEAFAADPGLVKTDIGLKCNSSLAATAWRYRRRRGIEPAQAASDIVWLLTEPKLDPANSFYYKWRKPKAPYSYTLEKEAASRLWDATERMCGCTIVEETACE